MITTPKIRDPYQSVPAGPEQLVPAGPEQLIQGVFEPPSGLTWTAITRHKLIVCMFAVLLAALGVAYGLSRPRVYTASATLQVGQVNPNSPGFLGYVQSATSLATAFSRAIDAEQVLDKVQHKLKLAPATSIARLSAEPLPLSPAFRVFATGPTEVAAVQLANVAANAVIGYEGQSNSANPEASTLLHEYREASLHQEQILSRLSGISQKTSRSAAERAQAQAEENAAQVKLKAIAVAYTAAIASQAPRNGLVSLVAGAAGASSDRSSKVEKLGLIGLLAGIVVGCGVAVLVERRRLARRLTSGGRTELQMSEQT
jgi:capsular polysaccharide biosynthesis protein